MAVPAFAAPWPGHTPGCVPRLNLIRRPPTWALPGRFFPTSSSETTPVKTAAPNSIRPSAATELPAPRRFRISLIAGAAGAVANSPVEEKPRRSRTRSHRTSRPTCGPNPTSASARQENRNESQPIAPSTRGGPVAARKRTPTAGVWSSSAVWPEAIHPPNGRFGQPK